MLLCNYKPTCFYSFIVTLSDMQCPTRCRTLSRHSPSCFPRSRTRRRAAILCLTTTNWPTPSRLNPRLRLSTHLQHQLAPLD